MVLEGGLESVDRFPSLLVMVPVFLATRGNVYGALGGRISSEFHWGLIEQLRVERATRQRCDGVVYQRDRHLRRVDMSGNLGASLSSRLSTRLHLGTAQIDLRDRELWANVAAILALVMTMRIFIGISALVFGL